jgi:hypothetical protein
MSFFTSGSREKDIIFGRHLFSLLALLISLKLYSANILF